MLNLNILIKYYLYFFLLIDAFSGFIRVYVGLNNPILNIGYWVRGPLFVLFCLYYLFQLKYKQIYKDELISIVLFFYLIFNTVLNYFFYSSGRLIYENIPYVLRFQFLIFLFVYLRNRFSISDIILKKVMLINFSVLSLNLFSGYFLGFGLEAYRFSGTSKGMFQGGNPVSILNLVFFSFYLLDGAFRKKFIPISISFLNGFIIASKSIFGFIIPIFFALKRRYLSLNKIIFYTSASFVLILTFSTISGKALELYEKRFGLNISKSIAAAEKVGGLYQNKAINSVASVNFRRYASMNIQIEESLTEIQKIVFGISFAGQKIFWERRGEFIFKHASMDFFDLLFKFGLVGLILYSSILFWNFKYFVNFLFKRDGLVVTLFLFYAFFGGHVIDSVTSGTLFYIFIARLSQNKNKLKMLTQ